MTDDVWFDANDSVQLEAFFNLLWQATSEARAYHQADVKAPEMLQGIVEQGTRFSANAGKLSKLVEEHTSSPEDLDSVKVSLRILEKAQVQFRLEHEDGREAVFEVEGLDLLWP